MQRRLLVAVAVVAVLVTGVVGQSGASGEAGPARDQTAPEHFAEVRASLGLVADPSTIESLISTFGLDPEWGIPFSPEEEVEVLRRVDIQSLFPESVVKALYQLPGFAGFYFDHKAGGVPTLLSTRVESAESALGGAIGGELSRLVRVRPAVWTYQQLEDAVDRLGGLMAQGIEYKGYDFANVTLVRLDTLNNRVVVGVDPAVFGPSVEAAIQEWLPVPVMAEPQERPQPEVCTSRSNCMGPLRAGVEIWRTGYGCTLGFGVWYGSDKQYLTAAHCGGTGAWTHSTMTIGTAQQSACIYMGSDAVRIQAAEGQVSNRIYQTPTTYRTVVGSTNPIVGSMVCVSGMHSSNCGTTVDDYILHSLCGQVVKGAWGNYAAQSGDSGAPIYQPLAGRQAWAIGIHSGGDTPEVFSRWQDIQVRLGVSCVF